ncbi:MAG: hypothetical protein WC364_08000 [Eubacteriales bacterium]|jgi:hypothetical protein
MAVEKPNDLSNNEFYQSAVDYLPMLAKGLMAIAELMHNGNEADGAYFFTKATDGLRWLAGFLKNIKSFDCQELEELGNYLTSLLDAWENDDYVLIGDLLEYELVPFVEQVNTCILS